MPARRTLVVQPRDLEQHESGAALWWRALMRRRQGAARAMHSMIHVRHAEPADAAQWAALRAALWPDEDDAAHAAEVSRFFAGSRRGLGAMPEAVFVALEPGRPPHTVVGFAEVSRRKHAEGCETSPVGFLEGWYVVPERRRHGVGRALVAAAEAWASGLGCREFASDALAANALSATAHRALGFEEVEVIRCFRKSLGPERPPSGR